MITIDVSAAVHARAGLGRYVEEVALAVGKERPVQLFHNLGAEGSVPPSLTAFKRFSVNYGYKPWRLAVLLAHLSRLSFNRLVPNTTIFHSTEHLLMPLSGVPTVLTVHDLIFKLFPEYHKSLNYTYLNLAVPIYCRRATAIIAVSQSTKNDIVTHYGIDPAKIHVIHEAAADHFKPPSIDQMMAVRQKFRLPPRFLVHLSTIEPRKNLSRLLGVLQRLRQTDPDLHLVLIGAKGWLYDDFFAKIEQLGLSDVVHSLGWVEDDELAAVIGAADLAVQPSLYEGFGLPVLEHMAVGQIVAASQRSSFPEVGGDAAAYFDPEDEEEMTAVIQRLLNNPQEREKRRALGLNQAKRFSWAETARQTIELYDRIRR